MFFYIISNFLLHAEWINAQGALVCLIDALWLSAIRANFQENTEAVWLEDKTDFEANDLHFASHVSHGVGVASRDAVDRQRYSYKIIAFCLCWRLFSLW